MQVPNLNKTVPHLVIVWSFEVVILVDMGESRHCTSCDISSLTADKGQDHAGSAKNNVAISWFFSQKCSLAQPTSNKIKIGSQNADATALADLISRHNVSIMLFFPTSVIYVVSVPKLCASGSTL